MRPHSEKYPRQLAAVRALRAALEVGYLTQAGRHWRFGRRLFHAITVNALIDAGEAVRVGDHVVRWRPAHA